MEWCLCSLDRVPDQMEGPAHILDRVQTTRLPILLLPSLFLIITGCHVS